MLSKRRSEDDVVAVVAVAEVEEKGTRGSSGSVLMGVAGGKGEQWGGA
jgi:hypothetical protein